MLELNVYDDCNRLNSLLFLCIYFSVMNYDYDFICIKLFKFLLMLKIKDNNFG